MTRRKAIIVELTGGLGNQLFQYVAGSTLARKNHLPLLLNLDHVHKGISNHRVSIKSLRLPGNYLQSEKKYRPVQELSRRMVNRAVAKSANIANLDYHLRNRYSSREIGYDSKLLKLSKPVYLRGYFQSWKYLEALEGALTDQEFELKNPSDWYRQMERVALSDEPISIHLRRGDYSQLSKSFGLLSQSYYINAITFLKSQGATGPIWVFSDDIKLAKNFFNHKIFQEAFYVEPLLGSDPAESLILMKHAKAHVIANSTFSWWGAQLRGPSAMVVAPDQWFRALTDPADLIPETWFRVESQWLD